MVYTLVLSELITTGSKLDSVSDFRDLEVK